VKVLNGGITKPKGFKANGIHCGIKRTKEDLCLIVSDTMANAACVFTKSSIKAAPLGVTKNHLRNNKALAIIVNSGNANCFTGRFGVIYAQKTCELIGTSLNTATSNVLVASTGIIGKALPYKKIQKKAKDLVKGLSVNGGLKAAKGILTTDLVVKQCSVSLTLGGKKVTIGGISKGSGMIAPNMATMLGFITTDAAISSAMLKKALAGACSKSFNCINVDGCMSTNDMVVILANGLADNKTITTGGKEYKKFLDALSYVCLELAKKIVLDGEGATKFIEIEVTGAKTEKQAHTVADAIGNSNLVKTAAFGSNPNWGRVAAAIGSVGIKAVSEENVKIDFTSFAKKNIKILIDLNIGKSTATVYTSDLSYKYVKINVEYN